jgi:CheY-like chemotaxis protein
MDAQQGYLLVVEDVSDILTLLDTTLKLRGHRVVTARNGQEALEMIERERPAIVITDILMPKLDGFGLIHRLRINPETRDMPVIVITATYVASEDKEFALNIGATRFLEKPVDLEQFLSIVAETLEKGTHLRPEPFDEVAFYEGYRKRLEAKLSQKISQIARIERLSETSSSPKNEDVPISTSLRLAINEREEIQFLLTQVNERFNKKIKPE